MVRRVAFFAPLKSPSDPVPSGDRAMARNLIAALEAGGSQVKVVSDLRLYDGQGDSTAQANLCRAAEIERALVQKRLSASPPDVWITYHNYYKSPDLIGPAIAASLGIPYVQIETSRARSRLNGPWSRFAKAAEAAADRAGLIFYLTKQDYEALARDCSTGQLLVHLRPFLPNNELPAPAWPKERRTVLVVGMMRSRAKAESYRLIAEALAEVADLDWQLEIAGDGPARAEIEAMMQPFARRTRFLGQLEPAALAAAYARAGLFLWPGVDEAYGMVYLEAQAAGLPVVAQNRPGVRDVLAPALEQPDPERGAVGLADALRRLLGDPELRAKTGDAARMHIAQHHLLDQAAACLDGALSRYNQGVAS